MNYVFISPNYPLTCASFCNRLHVRGVNVLGVGDAPYDALSDQLKGALTEYYQVSTLEDYEQVYRAVAFFIHKYGRIDWLESLNEYWLTADARLRTDFNIGVGTRADGIERLVDKAKMKQVFLDAGIPTARQHTVTTRRAAKLFVKKVGYPVIVKPSVGAGANGVRKLHDDAELDAFYAALPDEPYVMEEFLGGDIYTYDAILDSACEPLFESMNSYAPVLDAVQNDEDVQFCTFPEPAPQLRELGRRIVKAFGADRRFVHFEFIRLDSDHEGIGRAGDFAALEVNMRPSGGHDPDMMNFAQSADVFSIYAEMVTDDRRFFPASDDRWFCAYAARKDGHAFTHSNEEINERYASGLVMQEEMPPIDWPAMGRWAYMARFKTDQEMQEFFSYVLG